MIRRLLCAAAVAGFVVLGVAAGTAAAQQDSSELLQGNVRNEQNEDGEVTRVPVPDVKLTVAAAGGAEVGVATTDAEGHYELPLPGPGDYTVTIDQATLPEGVDLRDEAQAEVTVNIRPNERQVLNYFLGESTAPDRVAPGPAPPDDRQRHQVRAHHRHHARSGCR